MNVATLLVWGVLFALAGWRGFSHQPAADYALAVAVGRVVISAVIAGLVWLTLAVAGRFLRGRWPQRVLLVWGIGSIATFLLLELIERVLLA
jgi:hypothetical protein